MITGVAGLNNQTFSNGVTVPDPFTGTCTTCHDTPNAGNHSVKAPLNIGLTDASRRTPDMPLYTLRRISTGETVQTTDPGRAMITGKWADIGKFKGPILRALAARAPYFHNGSAATLDEVVDFYETRFNIGPDGAGKSGSGRVPTRTLMRGPSWLGPSELRFQAHQRIQSRLVSLALGPEENSPSWAGLKNRCILTRFRVVSVSAVPFRLSGGSRYVEADSGPHRDGGRSWASADRRSPDGTTRPPSQMKGETP